LGNSSLKPTSTEASLRARRTPESHRLKGLELLTSPGFLVSLFVLLLNDLVLKPNFDNWLVGKLSDFAGLFVFALFWTALFPRFQKLVFVFSGIGFIYWETSWSQPLIDAWNGLSVFSISRTVDYTDLTALLILFPAYLYAGRARQLTANALVRLAVVCLALFAFVATSELSTSTYSFDQSYDFLLPWQQLGSNVHSLGYNEKEAGGTYQESNVEAMWIEIPSDFCPPVQALILIRPKDSGSTMQLTIMYHSCDERAHTEADKRKLQQLFEDSVIDKLPPSLQPDGGGLRLFPSLLLSGPVPVV